MMYNYTLRKIMTILKFKWQLCDYFNTGIVLTAREL